MKYFVTGAAGFIGSNDVRWLLANSDHTVTVFDKLTYAGNYANIADLVEDGSGRCAFVQGDICDRDAVETAMAGHEIVVHFAAESHVDRSISGPGVFIESNVNGTYNLLQAVRSHYEGLSGERRDAFRMHHISTDEVFGSLGAEGRFSETTPYDPRSPYSASKAASDHLVQAWHHTFGLPVVLTNCSNNYGPWQFPEKLIPVVTLKAAGGEAIPL